MKKKIEAAKAAALRMERWRPAGALALVLAATGCATAPGDGMRSATTGREGEPLAASTGTTAPAVVRPYAAESTPPVARAQAPAPAIPAAVANATPAPEPVAVDPLRPEVRVDLKDSAAHADLWGRVRRGFALPDLQSDLVQTHEQWYASRPDYVERMTQRGSRYLFHVVEEVERRGLPTELALLPFIESAFNPQAMSSAKASGMWQFMPATGKYFALKQNLFRDDRRDVLASTRAALDYLEKLHGMFGDWHLALAAYNWGEGSVGRAIARNERAGLPTDYASLRMPAETQSYVPKLLAVKNIIARPHEFSLTLPVIENHPYFVSVAIERDIDVDIAARLAGLQIDEFKALNPQMNKPVILAAGTPQVLLPFENAKTFAQRLTAHRGPLASWTAWVVPSTMRPATAAREVGMSEEELRAVNRIPMRMLVRGGSTLLVARDDSRQADVSEHVADNASMALSPDVPPLRRLTYRAGLRDTPTSVARRYGVGPAQVAQWNGVSAGGVFRRGQTVVVYLPVGAALPRVAAAPVVRSAPVASPSRKVAAKPASPAARLAATPSSVGRAVARSESQARRPVAARSNTRRSAD